MYAEELTLLIRQKARYNGPSHNDSGAWRAAIEKACEVVDGVLEHAPKTVEPISYVAETTPETPVKKFGKKKEE